MSKGPKPPDIMEIMAQDWTFDQLQIQTVAPLLKAAEAFCCFIGKQENSHLLILFEKLS